MKSLQVLLLIFIFSSPIFAQKYLAPEQDVGFDVAQIIVTKANLRSAPSTVSNVINTFDKPYRLTLLNRQPTYSVWYEVSDINSLHRGYIHASNIEIYYTNPPVAKSQQISSPKVVCNSARSLTDAQDTGFDIAVVGKTDAKLVAKNQYGDYEATPLSLNQKLAFISQSPNSLLVKVLDISSGKLGEVLCDAVQIYFSSKKREQESPFIKTCSGSSYRQPVTEITNNTDRTLTLYVDDIQYVIYSGGSKTIDLIAGTHTYLATAPRAIPLKGSDVWEAGCRYTWTFYISKG